MKKISRVNRKYRKLNCKLTRSKNVSNSKHSEVRVLVPMYVKQNVTEDSSLSSTCSILCQNNVLTYSQSQVDSLKNLENFLPSSDKLIESKNVKNSNLCVVDLPSKDINGDFKYDLFCSEASNSSLNDEVVRVTDTSKLDMTNAMQVMSPQINNIPDVVLRQVYNPVAYSMQLLCDQQKLERSSIMADSIKDNNTDIESESTNLHSLVRNYVSIAAQTLPVLILPVLDEVNKRSNDDQDSKTNEMTFPKSSESKPQIQTSEQETQAPSIRLSRTKTQSDFTTFSKENTDLLIESSPHLLEVKVEEKPVPEVVWGDVYNDYKEKGIEPPETTPTVTENHKKIKPKKRNRLIKVGIRGSSKGGDIIRELPDLHLANKESNLLSVVSVAPSYPFKYGSKRYGKNISVKVPVNKDKKTDNEHFQKFFELHPHDELVKSYLTMTDRRIRSICSKIGCHIGMYGPVAKYQTESSKLAQLSVRMTRLYYIKISADTKERLDKSVKCIQETFPKACLTEKTNNQPFLENCGEEIPI